MDPIISRESLAADAAAQRFVATGIEQDCEYVSGTEASREWRAVYQTRKLLHSAAVTGAA
jgi:hypothetical protein